MASSLKAQAIIVAIKAVPADGMSAAAVKRASARPNGQLAINLHDIPQATEGCVGSTGINLDCTAAEPISVRPRESGDPGVQNSVKELRPRFRGDEQDSSSSRSGGRAGKNANGRGEPRPSQWDAWSCALTPAARP